MDNNYRQKWASELSACLKWMTSFTFMSKFAVNITSQPHNLTCHVCSTISISFVCFVLFLLPDINYVSHHNPNP